jgi:Skp family chaperone for outer membrane proteins
MKAIKYSVASLLLVSAAVMSLSGCDKGNAVTQNVAYINMGEVLSQSSIGKQEASHTDQVKAILQKAEKDAENTYKTMPTEQVEKSRSADATIINRQWVAEQRQARAESLKAVVKVVEAYRSSKKISLVLDSSNLVAASKESDITKEIIGELKDVKVDYGKLPEISIKKEDDNAKSAEKADKK